MVGLCGGWSCLFVVGLCGGWSCLWWVSVDFQFVEVFDGAMAASLELWEVASSQLVGQSGLGGVW